MNSISTRRPDATGYIYLTVAVVAWAAIVVVAAESGVLALLGAAFMPGYALLVAIGILVPTAAYFSLQRVRKTVDAVGIHRLTLFHIWRIPAALAFFYYGVQGQLPTLFWVLAGVGDLLAGLYAATMLWGARTPQRYLRVHLFGFADFVLAVGTGLTFTLMGEHRMALLTTLPMALIPLFGVGISGANHIVALTTLLRAESAPTAKSVSKN